MRLTNSRVWGIVLIFVVISTSCVYGQGESDGQVEVKNMADNENVEYATIGGGCFWCIEAVYQRIDGVHSVVSGYAGGTTVNPTYKDISYGSTGHAEVVQIGYDKTKISFEDILKLFWKAHDPTTLNRQGADVGSQYRSIILFHNEEQRLAAEKSKAELDASGRYEFQAVTQIVPLTDFYEAEEYHQDYYEKNPDVGYCRVVIQPKLDKLNLPIVPEKIRK